MQQHESNLVTPPQGPRSRSMTDGEFVTPRQHSAGGRILKERVPDHELTAIREAASLSFQTHDGKDSFITVPSDASFNTSCNSDTSRRSLDRTAADLIGRQWHSCNDVRPGNFSEPAIEVTFNEAAQSELGYPINHGSNQFRKVVPQQQIQVGSYSHSFEAVPNVMYCPSQRSYSSYSQSSSCKTSPAVHYPKPVAPHMVPNYDTHRYPTDCSGYSHYSVKSIHQPATTSVRYNVPSSYSVGGPHGSHHQITPSSCGGSMHIQPVAPYDPYSRPQCGEDRPVSQLSYTGSMYGDNPHRPGSVCSDVGDQSSVISSASEAAENLTSWQKKHQMHLKRQQESNDEGSNKWSALQRAADGIIREKDMIIERQKTQILKMEQQTNIHEDNLKRALSLGLSKDSNTDTLSYRYQDMQLENSTQRVQLSELLAKKDQEIENLTQKLGAVEYQLQQFDTELQQKEIIPKTDWIKLNNELGKNEKMIKDLKEKQEELVDELIHKKEKLTGLERYVADLPTQDDHNKKEQQLKSLRENEIIFKSRIADVESTVTEKIAELTIRDQTIKSYEVEIDDLKTKISGLEIDLERFQEPDKNGKLLASKKKDIDDLMWENKKLHSDFDKMKKFMEARTKKFQQCEAKLQAQIKQFEEQTVADENTVNALQLDLVSKENELREVKQALKQLTKTNQDLRGKNLSLEEKANEFDRIMSSSQQRLEKKIMKEVNKCVTELQSLVETCLQHSQGQDPNLSMLLGVKASSLSDNEDENHNNDSEDVLREKLARIRNLRKDIDILRDQVSGKLAEDMGDNINCVTQ